MAYTKTNYNPDSAPGISADNLNKIEDELVRLGGELDGMGGVSSKITTIQSTSATSLGSESGKKAVFLSFSKQNLDGLFQLIDSYDGESHALNLSTTSTKPGYIYVALPNSSATTRYKVKYYFSGDYLYVAAPAELVGFIAKSIWHY